MQRSSCFAATPSPSVDPVDPGGASAGAAGSVLEVLQTPEKTLAGSLIYTSITSLHVSCQSLAQVAEPQLLPGSKPKNTPVCLNFLLGMWRPPLRKRYDTTRRLANHPTCPNQKPSTYQKTCHDFRDARNAPSASQDPSDVVQSFPSFFKQLRSTFLAPSKSPRFLCSIARKISTGKSRGPKARSELLDTSPVGQNFQARAENIRDTTTPTIARAVYWPTNR